MRILHVIHSLDPSTGGPPRVTARLAAAQATLGHDVRIATYDSPDARSSIAEMTAPLPGFDKVDTTYVAGPLDAFERVFARRAARALVDLVRQSDVVHLYNLWEPIIRVAGREARRQRRPYVVQPNGILDPWALAQKGLKKKMAMAVSYRRLLNRAAGLLMGNEEELRLVRPLGLAPPTFVIPLNGIFPEEVGTPPPAGSFYARYPRLEGRPFVVFLGRFHYKKGVDRLAEAFALFARRDRDVRLVMVGYDEGAQADFERRIERHGLTDRVLVLGPLHGAAKWEAFRDAACFILPSHQEGFSIAITEALACGLPVIITKGCHFDEVAEAGAGEVVDLDDAQLADALTRVFADESRRKRMGEAARTLIAKKFNCYRMGEHVLDVYARVVEGRGVAASTNPSATLRGNP